MVLSYRRLALCLSCLQLNYVEFSFPSSRFWTSQREHSTRFPTRWCESHSCASLPGTRFIIGFTSHGYARPSLVSLAPNSLPDSQCDGHARSFPSSRQAGKQSVRQEAGFFSHTFSCCSSDFEARRLSLSKLFAWVRLFISSRSPGTIPFTWLLLPVILVCSKIVLEVAPWSMRIVVAIVLSLLLLLLLMLLLLLQLLPLQLLLLV